jgi:hypothetical protein
VTLQADGPVEQGAEAVSFDGASASVVSQEVGPVDPTKSFTVTAWVSLTASRLLGATQYATAVSQVGSAAAAFYLGVAEGRWDFTMKDADTNDPGHSTRASGPKATFDGKEWVHLAGAYDAGSHEIRLYVDGEMVAETPFAAPWKPGGPLTVGRSQAHGTPSDYWPGAVADLGIYTNVLDKEQIAGLFGSGRPRSAPPSGPQPAEAAMALDGTYVYEMTGAESKRLEQLFGEAADAAGFPGDASVVQKFAGGQWQQYYLVDGKPYLVDGLPEGDRGIATVDGDVLTLDNGQGAAEYRWKKAKDMLSLTLLTDVGDPVVGFVMEHDYTKVEG